MESGQSQHPYSNLFLFFFFFNFFKILTGSDYVAMKTLKTKARSPNNLTVKTLAMCILFFIHILSFTCYRQRWCYVPLWPRKRTVLAWDTARVRGSTWESSTCSSPGYQPGLRCEQLALFHSLFCRFREDAQLLLTNSYWVFKIPPIMHSCNNLRQRKWQRCCWFAFVFQRELGFHFY